MGNEINRNNKESMFASLCLGTFFNDFKKQDKTKWNKIRRSGCDCELGDIGDTQRNKQHRSHRGPFREGPLFARIFILFMLADDARQEA